MKLLRGTQNTVKFQSLARHFNLKVAQFLTMIEWGLSTIILLGPIQNSCYRDLD